MFTFGKMFKNVQFLPIYFAKNAHMTQNFLQLNQLGCQNYAESHAFFVDRGFKQYLKKLLRKKP